MMRGMKTVRTVRLVHVSAPVTITVLFLEGGHVYADDSRFEELEWLGGAKAARDYIARECNRGGFVRVAA